LIKKNEVISNLNEKIFQLENFWEEEKNRSKELREEGEKWKELYEMEKEGQELGGFDLDFSKDEIASLTIQVENLNKKLKEVKKEKMGLETENSMLDKKNMRLTFDCERLEKTLEEKNKILGTLREDYDNLQMKYREARVNEQRELNKELQLSQYQLLEQEYITLKK
jgi:muconolactone delta-isomerase